VDRIRSAIFGLFIYSLLSFAAGMHGSNAYFFYHIERIFSVLFESAKGYCKAA